MTATREERDLLGPVQIPERALYGVNAGRAVENFPSPGLRLADVPEFCRAFGMVKLAAARANLACGTLEQRRGRAIERAGEELAAGEEELLAALVVPVAQGGAGTSTNMNVNEVLANRALAHLGHPPGSYEHCHPNDDVNRSQSTNDAYPSALRIALAIRSRGPVEAALRELVAELHRVADRFSGAVKLGRTQLQDAVPMTVDQEVRAWADQVLSALDELRRSEPALLEVNLGGTAVGTGLTTPAEYREIVLPELAAVSGQPVTGARRPVSATVDGSAFLALSNGLRCGAIALAKVANDLRLLSSGPRAGLGEYRLPARQAGSSMMPGKINPVVPEFVNQLAFKVRGADSTVEAALDAGQLQLNAMLPVVAEALFEAQRQLATAAEVFAEKCLHELEIDAGRMSAGAAEGLGQASLVAAEAGYQAASALVAEARARDATPDEVIASPRGSSS